jgi:uroporphyrinogen decarboxylase
MNSRERVIATLDFTGPDRIPLDCWILGRGWKGREAEMSAITARYPTDFAGLWSANPYLGIGTNALGTYTDAWGCEWLNLDEGIIGEVKKPVFADYAVMRGFQWPMDSLDSGWDNAAAHLDNNRDKFIIGGGGNPFERMQFLRGTENLYMDLAEESDEVYELRDRLLAFYRKLVEKLVTYDVDAIQFADDWGSQRALLIHPEQWRKFYKPVYRELMAIARDAGKYVFFHSDGYIIDIYPDLIECGVNALNSQVWCMGIDTVAPFAGQLTFWGELDRQNLLPYGTPAQIRAAAHEMKTKLYRNGGLIGQCEIDYLTSLENVEAFFTAWNE